VGRRESGKTYLDEVLAKIPDEAKRKEAAAILSPVEAVLDTLGDGYLRQEDHTKGRNELAEAQKLVEAERARLTGWLKDQEAYLKEYNEIKPKYDEFVAKGGNGNGDDDEHRATIPAEVMKKLERLDELEKGLKERLDGLEANGVGLMVEFHKLDRQHREEFNAPLDFDDLLKYAKEKGTNVRAAYMERFAEARATAAKTKYDDAIKLAEQRGRDAATRDFRSQLPHIVDTQEPSTLSGLKREGEDPVRAAVKAAIEDHYSGKFKGGAEA
jgi:hypothetical protein